MVRFYPTMRVVSVVAMVMAGQVWAAPAPTTAPAMNPPRVAAPGARPLAPRPATAPFDPNAPRPKMRCDETTYQFPEVWSGDIVDHDFVIHNDGDAPLELLSVHGSCSCTATSADKVIAPGKQGKVNAKLNTARMSHTVTRTISVQSNDPVNKNMTLTLKGEVKPRIDVAPSTYVNFGSVNEESDLTRTVKVTNNTNAAMKLELIPVPPGQKSVFQAEVKELTPGKVAEIKVTATRPFNEGNNNAALRYKTGIEQEQQLVISCALYSPPLVQVMPATLPVSIPVVGAQAPRNVNIVYNGKGTLDIQSAKVDNDAVTLDLVKDPKGRTHRLTVKIAEGFDPASTSPIDIVLKTDLASMPEIKIPIMPIKRQTPPTVPPRQPTPTVARPADLIGRPTPPVSLVSLMGQGLQAGVASGQITVVNFWASWSGLSRQQLQVVQSLSNLYSRRGVTFINISLDALRPVNEVREAVTQLNVSPASVAVDPRCMTALRFGIKAVPTLFVIGRNGIVEAAHEGFGSSQEPAAYEQMVRGELDALIDGRTRADFPREAVAAAVVDTMDSQTLGAQARVPTPRLTVEAAQQNVGMAKPGAKVTYRLYCRNDGGQALSLTSVASPQGVTVQPGYSTTLQPGATTAIVCEFEAGAKPGPFSHQITINSNDGARPRLDVTLVGAVRPYVEVEPPGGIDFGRNPRIQSMGRMATLLYNGADSVDYLSASSSSPKFEATVEKLRAGQNAKLIVNAKPPFEIGEHKAVITVKTTCKEQPTVEVPVSLYNPKRIEVQPAEVVVGGPERMPRITVEINNNGMESLHILGVDSSNKRIRTQFYPEPDGFSYKLVLILPGNYVPPAGGDKITIRTDDKDFGELVIPIHTAS
jgi:hypothetical protein